MGAGRRAGRAAALAGEVKVQSLGRAQQFNRENISEGLRNEPGSSCRNGGHGDMVFVVLHGWHTVNTGWVRKPLALTDKGSGSVLGQHQAAVKARVFD